MQWTEQSKHRAGREQDRPSPNWNGRAEIMHLEDLAQAFGARIPASITHFAAHDSAVRYMHRNGRLCLG